MVKWRLELRELPQGSQVNGPGGRAHPGNESPWMAFHLVRPHLDQWFSKWVP